VALSANRLDTRRGTWQEGQGDGLPSTPPLGFSLLASAEGEDILRSVHV
jgi:hypothetical protein